MSKIKQKRAYQWLAIIAISFFMIPALTSCKSDNSKKAKSQQDGIQADLKEIDEDAIFEDITNAKQAMIGLPSPIESARMLKESGAKYNAELLNPDQNAVTYTTSKARALNMGIFCTDLSYASMFDQTQASIKYMNATKKMADGLGILEAMNSDIIERLEENINNKDVILDIISETFMNSNNFLIENEQNSIAALLLVGGWLEGLYLATEIATSTTENKKLVENIAIQKVTLINVLKILDNNKADASVLEVYNKMSQLTPIFAKFKNSASKNSTATDKDGVTVIKSSSETTINDEVLNELRAKVNEIRTGYIQ